MKGQNNCSSPFFFICWNVFLNTRPDLMTHLYRLGLVTWSYQLRIPVGPDICHRGCAYTVLQAVQRHGVYSAVYETVHYKKSFEIRVGHSAVFGLPSVARLPQCEESDVNQYSLAPFRQHKPTFDMIKYIFSIRGSGYNWNISINTVLNTVFHLMIWTNIKWNQLLDCLITQVSKGQSISWQRYKHVFFLSYYFYIAIISLKPKLTKITGAFAAFRDRSVQEV